MEDVFKKDKDVLKFYSEVNRTIYSLMTRYSQYKEGSIFFETADELTTTVLKNRSQQTTRWSRAELGCLTAFIRNAGTIYTVLGKEELEAALERNLTKQKEIRQLSQKLKSARFWLLLIGYCQIFDHLVAASLEAQHGSYCSSSSLKLVLDAMTRIRTLGKS